MTVSARLLRDYRVAFLRYLPRREEAPLRAGYELGRTAVAEGVSVLEVARIHHKVLAEVLRDTAESDLEAVTAAASEFLLEALSTFDMTHRGFRDAAGDS